MYVCVYAKDIKKILPHKLRDKSRCQEICTRQVDADSGGVIEARQPDNGGFDTGGYTDTRGGNIEGQYIVKAIIVPFLNI